MGNANTSSSSSREHHKSGDEVCYVSCFSCLKHFNTMKCYPEAVFPRKGRHSICFW